MDVDYAPFEGVSDYLRQMTLLDLQMLRQVAEEHNIIMDSLLDCSVLQKLANNQKYHLVGFLVAFFTYQVEARKLRPTISYLELQCKVENLNYTPMTMKEGYDRLKEILKESESKTMPFILFIDDFAFERELKDWEWNVFCLLRSVCQCIQVMIVFLTSDARASNMNMVPGSDKNQSEWMIGGFRTPSYDKNLLNSKCAALNEKFENHPQLQKIVSFVQNVAPLELPLLVGLCLDFLQTTSLDDPWKVLHEMITECSHEYSWRKTYWGRIQEPFNGAQVCYMSLPLHKSTTSVSLRGASGGRDEFMNKHLANLFAYPDERDCPYFTLSTCPHGRVYSRDRRIGYESKSVFASFRDAPITGMTLFGLSSEHNVFISDNSICCQWFQAELPKTLLAQSTGFQLKVLFNCCAIIASKANGPKGCSMSDFLTVFFKELVISGPIVQVNSADNCPWEGDNGKRIPMLAPMSMCSWNSELCLLFKDLLPANEPPCLGVYTLGNGCDGFAYFYDPSEPLEEEIEDEKIEYAMKTMNLEYPEPFVRPYRGALTGIRTNLNNAAFAVECVENKDGASAIDIFEIIKNKFTGMDCNLFFIFVWNFHKTAIAELTRKLDPTTNNFVFWSLKTIDSCSFTLHKITDACPAHDKHIVLLSLKTIWDYEYEYYRWTIFKETKSRE